MTNIRRIAGLVTLAAVLAAGPAQAVWNGLANPALGQPDGTNTVFVELPNEPAPQQAISEEDCNEAAEVTGEDCPPGFDWYVRADYKWSAGLDLRVEYRTFDDTVVGEGFGTTGADGNLGTWNSYTIQTEFGTIRVGDQYAGQEGQTAQPSDINASDFSKGARDAFRSHNWAQGLEQSYTPGTINNAFTDAFGGGISSDIIRDTYTQIGRGGAYSTRPNFTQIGRGGLSADRFANPVAESFVRDYVKPRFEVTYRIDPDGWYGQSLGDGFTDTGTTFINPIFKQPRFDIGFNPGFDPQALPDNFFYSDAFINAPRDAGGNFIGQFNGGLPDRDYQGLSLSGRYRLSDNWTISGNYTYSKPDTGQALGLGAGDPVEPFMQASFVADLGGPIFKDKIWFFVNADCDKVLQPAEEKRPAKLHVRITPPTAVEFVEDPDTRRGLWHKDYDGALPILVSAKADKAAVVRAIETLINAPFAWFVPGEIAARLGADSAAGQGGTGGGSGAPEIAIGDDDCDKNSTVIVPNGQGPAVQEGNDGLSTQTRDPNEPCDCSREAANVAEGRAWRDRVQNDLDSARDQLRDLQAEWASVRAEHNRRVDAMTQAAANAGGTDTPALEAARDAYYDYLATRNGTRDRVEAAEQEVAEMEQMRREAGEALAEAERALADCQRRCGLAGTTGDGEPTGGTDTGGPGIASGDSQSPDCDCSEEQRRVDRAREDVEATRARIDGLNRQMDQLEAEREGHSDTYGRQLVEKGRMEYQLGQLQGQVGQGQQGLDQAIAGLERRLQLLAEAIDTNLAEMRDVTARQADIGRMITQEAERLERELAALQRAEAALAACLARRPQGGGSTTTGPGAGTGTQPGSSSTADPGSGTSTTAPNNDGQQPCDCLSQEQALRDATQARESAEEVLARLRAQHRLATETRDERLAVKREQISRIARLNSRIADVGQRVRHGETALQQTLDGLNARAQLLGDALRASEAEIDRLNGELADLEGQINDQQHEVNMRENDQIRARQALEQCRRSCPPGGGQ